uniref:Uncharacterized protein n=1 Tax=mine drainage metagenome TaxID=410659 RepID=E6QA25_9ZZZZ
MVDAIPNQAFYVFYALISCPFILLEVFHLAIWPKIVEHKQIIRISAVLISDFVYLANHMLCSEYENAFPPF